MSTKLIVSQPDLRSTRRRPPVSILIRAVLAAVCVLLPGATAGTAGAADHGRTITLGESNTADQRDELLAYFETGADDRILDVTLVDTQRAMEGILDVSDITSAYSSTALTCRSAGTGVDVTTRNIEVVPPALYAMALATAGIDDATLVVAAPDDAPAEGMTALTGVFQTWDVAPCGGASLDPARQALALEELALAVRIGDGIGGDTGTQDATVLLLAIQQAIVVDAPEGRAGVAAAIEAQERATGVAVPDAERDDLTDLMARLASRRIDWGSFDRGWRLSRTDDDRVTLRSLAAADADAIASASRATATPAPKAASTSTPSPTASSTTTPESIPASGAVGSGGSDAAGGASVATSSTVADGAGLPLLKLGAGLLALGLLAGLLLLLRRRRRSPVEIGFTPRARPTVVASVRQEVVRRTTEGGTTSWYRPRQRPGHPDGTTG